MIDPNREELLTVKQAREVFPSRARDDLALDAQRHAWRGFGKHLYRGAAVYEPRGMFTLYSWVHFPTPVYKFGEFRQKILGYHSSEVFGPVRCRYNC